MASTLKADLRDIEEELRATQDPEKKSQLKAEKRKLEKELHELQRPAGVVTRDYAVEALRPKDFSFDRPVPAVKLPDALLLAAGLSRSD